MNICPITFGKTIEIYAPFHEARRVANAINYKKDDIQIVNPQVKEQVKKIFDDTDLGHAIAYWGNDYNSCHIFSGKESKEYQKNLLNRARKIIDAKEKYPYQKRESIKQIRQAREEFFDKTAELIKRTRENFGLKIYPNAEKIEKVELAKVESID